MWPNLRSKNQVTEEGDVDDVRPQSAPIANLETGNNVSHQLHILQPQKTVTNTVPNSLQLDW